MNDSERDALIVSAVATASYAADGMEVLWRVALAKGVIAKADAIDLWDRIILRVQEKRQSVPWGLHVIPDNMIDRAEQFLKEIASTEP